MTENFPDPALHGAVRVPSDDVPVARSNSVRLVSRLDLSRPDGADGLLELSGRAWEFEIDARAAESVRDAATLEAVVNYHDGRTLTEIRTSPDVPGLETLVGAPAIAGFRGRVGAVVAGDVAHVGAPLAQLLDDVPLGTLISGHAVSAERALDPSAAAGGTGYVPVGDQCAGYVDGGALISTIAVRGRSPVADGPVAPPLDDAFGRTPPALGIHAMRRRRRIDRWTENGELRFDAMFRDTYVRADGVETVIHEYELAVAVDAATGVVREAKATPRVLPWSDCPGAVASAGRLVGTALSEVEADVRRRFRGVETCTHLNDLLRSITR